MAQGQAGLRVVKDTVQRQFKRLAARYIQKRAMRPQGSMERREFTFAGCNSFRHQVWAHQIAIFTDGSVQIGEDDALLAQRLVQLVVNNLAVYRRDQSALPITDQRGAIFSRDRVEASAEVRRQQSGLLPLNRGVVGAPPFLGLK